MEKTTFIAPNGVEVEGIVLYASKAYKAEKSATNCYDEIVYAQKHIAKLHYTLNPVGFDEDIYSDRCPYPEVEILVDYVVIPELE